MVFVKPHPLSWALMKPFQLFSMVIGLLALAQFETFYVPFLKTSFLPTVDSNPFFKLTHEGSEACNFFKFILNSGLIALFWLQHSTMSRSWFKKFMNDTFGNQYYYFQKGAYSLVSGILMFMLFFLWQPINTVIIPDHNNPYIKMGANALIIIGSYMNIQATYDLIDDDLFGYIQQSWFKKEGQDLPTPFVLKRLSRLSLSMRHPLYSGSLVKLFAVLLHGEVTIGRALYILQFIICTSLGSYFEERQLEKDDMQTFKKICTIIPNKLLPRLTVLFGSREKIEELKQKMIKVS